MIRKFNKCESKNTNTNCKPHYKAEKYLKDALANIKKSKGDKRAWLAYCKLGYTYLENKNNEKAKEVLLKSYEEADQIDHIIGKVLSLQNLGECELALGNKEKALELCEQALRLSNENVGLDHFNTSISLTKVMVLGELKEYQKMILILDDVSSKINVERMFLGLHEFYIKAYEGLEDYKSALKHQRLYTELKEKLYGFDLKKHSEELESKYQNKLKEREKEILRLQKVELEQKAIRAQLNPHFFFNALNSIQKFIVDNDEENATRYLQSFSGLMRKTLENSEEMFISLEDEIAYLKDYLTLEQLRCNNSFQFEFIIDEEIEDDFVKLPTMLLQPYVENAIKHGINGLKDGLVVINFCLDVNENLLCTIQDNGKGIKQKSKTVKHKSMATKLLQKRILALEEQFQVAFQINTLDLSEQNKSKTGTRVEVLIPQIEHAAK